MEGASHVRSLLRFYQLLILNIEPEKVDDRVLAAASVLSTFRTQFQDAATIDASDGHSDAPDHSQMKTDDDLDLNFDFDFGGPSILVEEEFGDEALSDEGDEVEELDKSEDCLDTSSMDAAIALLKLDEDPQPVRQPSKSTAKVQQSKAKKHHGE